MTKSSNAKKITELSALVMNLESALDEQRKISTDLGQRVTQEANRVLVVQTENGRLMSRLMTVEASNQQLSQQCATLNRVSTEIAMDKERCVETINKLTSMLTDATDELKA